MSPLLSLTWRLLLAAALVFNPVAGAGMAFAATKAPAQAVAVVAKAPPCHGMAMHQDAAHDLAKAKPAHGHDGDHGCGCGNAACQFGACCATGALDVPAVQLARAVHGVQALPLPDFSGAASPPLSRMIRPPIA